MAAACCRLRSHLSSRAFQSQPRLTPAFCKVITRQPSLTAWRTAAVAAGRQPQPPVKATLRQLKPMNDGSAQGSRIDSRPGDHQFAVFDGGFHLFGVNAGQRDQRQNLKLRLQNIDRRFPGRLPGLRAGGPEQLAMHPLGTREHLARFRPHPIAGHVTGHRASPPALVCICVASGWEIQRPASGIELACACLTIPTRNHHDFPPLYRVGPGKPPIAPHVHMTACDVSSPMVGCETERRCKWHEDPLRGRVERPSGRPKRCRYP